MRPIEEDCLQLDAQFVHEAMMILMNRCPEFSNAKDQIDPHIHHNPRSIMDLASVTVLLGIVDENQASTAGTISILNQCQKKQNADSAAGAVWQSNEILQGNYGRQGKKFWGRLN